MIPKINSYEWKKTSFMIKTIIKHVYQWLLIILIRIVRSIYLSKTFLNSTAFWLNMVLKNLDLISLIAENKNSRRPEDAKEIYVFKVSD